MSLQEALRSVVSWIASESNRQRPSHEVSVVPILSSDSRFVVRVQVCVTEASSGAGKTRAAYLETGLTEQTQVPHCKAPL